MNVKGYISTYCFNIYELTSSDGYLMKLTIFDDTMNTILVGVLDDTRRMLAAIMAVN
jgi:hypothetical protein